jgi:hypothetical protein
MNFHEAQGNPDQVDVLKGHGFFGAEKAAKSTAASAAEGMPIHDKNRFSRP